MVTSLLVVDDQASLDMGSRSLDLREDLDLPQDAKEGQDDPGVKYDLGANHREWPRESERPRH